MDQTFSLTSSQSVISVQFVIFNDAISEMEESFTATIVTSAPRVSVLVAETEVFITDNDCKFQKW